MTSASAFTEPSRKVVDDAIRWLVRLNHGTPDAAARSAFQQWLLLHPTHAEAWRRISGLDADLARLAGDTSAGLPESIGRPLRAGLTRHTLGMAADARQQREAALRRQALKTLCWVGTGAAALWLGHREAPWQRLVADISTGIGERHDMHLPDGTVLALNTDTAMKLDFTHAAPQLTLLRGECMVQTPARPAAPRSANPAVNQPTLRLSTPHGDVRALQARFVARLMPDAVQLSVVKGSVRTDALAGPAMLQAGQHAHLREGRLLARPDLGLASDGFTDGVIQARAARLGDLVDELSRHQVGHVSCDPSLALRRITGVFQLQNLTGTLRFIARTQGLTLHRRTPWWLHLAPATTA